MQATLTSGVASTSGLARIPASTQDSDLQVTNMSAGSAHVKLGTDWSARASASDVLIPSGATIHLRLPMDDHYHVLSAVSADGTALNIAVEGF